MARDRPRTATSDDRQYYDLDRARRDRVRSAGNGRHCRGATYIDASRCTVLPTSRGNIRIITATHSVMDRLIAAVSWQDAPSLEQALLVARHQADSIDWSEIDTWVVAEGISSAREVVEFYRATRRTLPI